MGIYLPTTWPLRTPRPVQTCSLDDLPTCGQLAFNWKAFLLHVDTRLPNVKHMKYKLKKTMIKILFPIFLKKILILSDIYLGPNCIMDFQRKIYSHSNLSMHDTTSQIFKNWINIDWSTWSSKPHSSKLHKYCNQGGCEEQIKQWVEREMPGD